MNVNDSLIV